MNSIMETIKNGIEVEREMKIDANDSLMIMIMLDIVSYFGMDIWLTYDKE